MAKKNVRNMKVCGQSGYKYETVPAITLKGKWLEELGFHLGDYVRVKCENGQLIITPDVNKAQEQEAKTAFMDEEIKKPKIRYQNEKEEITAKYVAEQSTGCYGKKAREGENVWQGLLCADHLKGELARLPAPGTWLIHWRRGEKGFWLLILTARQI